MATALPACSVCRHWDDGVCFVDVLTAPRPHRSRANRQVARFTAQLAWRLLINTGDQLVLAILACCIVLVSVCLSVHLWTLNIVAKRYILQKNSQNMWIGGALPIFGTRSRGSAIHASSVPLRQITKSLAMPLYATRSEREREREAGGVQYGM